MGFDIPAVGLISFIVGDFEAAWDSLAANAKAENRGNFMFALHSMVLLEVACRVCASDATGDALRAFSQQLATRDPRYFTALPGSCAKGPSDFTLPHLSDPVRELLPALFDLVRNGQGHQYQQIRVQLTDGVDFQVAISGAESGAFLTQTLANGRPADHLAFFGGSGKDLWLKLRTDVLFLDVRDSIVAADLPNRQKFAIDHLERPRHQREYQFSARDLERAFKTGGHSSAG